MITARVGKLTVVDVSPYSDDFEDSNTRDYIDCGPGNDNLAVYYSAASNGDNKYDQFIGGSGKDTIDFSNCYTGSFSGGLHIDMEGLSWKFGPYERSHDGRKLIDKSSFVGHLSVESFETVIGSGGDDWIAGSSKKDRIIGDWGNDYIVGFKSKDTLTGGPGKDWFAYTSITDSPNSDSADVITDFSVRSDKIDLTYIDADTRYFSNDDFRFVGRVSSSSQIRGGEVGYVISGGMTRVLANIWNSYSDSTCEIRIDLVGQKTLTASNFLL